MNSMNVNVLPILIRFPNVCKNGYRKRLSVLRTCARDVAHFAVFTREKKNKSFTRVNPIRRRSIKYIGRSLTGRIGRTWKRARSQKTRYFVRFTNTIVYCNTIRAQRTCRKYFYYYLLERLMFIYLCLVTWPRITRPTVVRIMHAVW